MDIWRQNAIVEACQVLAEQENMKVTLEESTKGAAIIGISALLGGLLGGKQGLLAGAAVGSAASFALGSEFKSVFEIIRDDMTPAQRRQLAGSINSILGGMQITNAVSVLALLSRNSNLKSSVLQQIIYFFQQEMNMSIL
ncbi:hypothetical protein JTB14_023756 [Gonioctena quinquepunctata]|nr:hypothetical protein JTB14_023756 [Gonioctena quinquepunctata]